MATLDTVKKYFIIKKYIYLGSYCIGPLLLVFNSLVVFRTSVKPAGEKKVWEKSIGSLSTSKKSALGIIVKKKSATNSPSTSTNTSKPPAAKEVFKTPTPVLVKPTAPQKPAESSAKAVSNKSPVNPSVSANKSPAAVPVNPIGGLGGLLGDYSDSGSNSE